MNWDGIIRAVDRPTPIPASQQIERELVRCDYSPSPYRDPLAERDGWPPFCVPFHLWVWEHEIIPTPYQLLKLYFSLYPWADNGHRAGLEARGLRAWASLVRDFHLGALLREAGMETRISLQADVQGTDVLVFGPKDTTLKVHAYVWTPRAKSFRDRKPDGREHFDLPLIREEAREVHNVWLYQHPLHTDRVRRALEHLK